MPTGDSTYRTLELNYKIGDAVLSTTVTEKYL